jgi:hypothetical protein
MRRINLVFRVSGHVSQDVALADGVRLEVLQEKLESGEWLPSLDLGGNLLSKEGEVLGRVLDLDAHLEYKDVDAVFVDNVAEATLE